MKAHPLSNYLPELGSEGIKELAEDMKENGQREDIVLLDGMILDGRNRFAGCAIAKLKPRTRNFNPKKDGDPIKYVLSQNVHRRHLTEAQRIDIAAELAKESERGRPEVHDQTEVSNGKTVATTIASAAELMKVNPTAVARRKRVLTHGSADLNKAVSGGKVSVSAAAKALKKPKKDQLKAALNPPKAKAKKEKRESPKEKLLAALDQLWLENRTKWNEPPMCNPTMMVRHFQKLIEKTL